MQLIYFLEFDAWPFGPVSHKPDLCQDAMETIIWCLRGAGAKPRFCPDQRQVDQPRFQGLANATKTML